MTGARSGGAAGPARAGAPAGLRTLGSETFSLAEAVGGWRGLVESATPGLVFVVVFVATRNLPAAIMSSLAVTAIAVVARLVRRSSVTYALGGVIGVGVGALWAWRSDQAENYFAGGLLTNAGFAVAVGISLLVRYPLVGLLAGALGLTRREHAEQVPAGASDGPAGAAAAGGGQRPGAPDAPLLDLRWRSDPDERRRYTLATWLWLGAFLARLAVQVPLYFGGSVGWLGTARLVMGLPMWALVLWLTWLLVRPRPRETTPPPTTG